MKFRTWNRPPPPCKHDKLDSVRDPVSSAHSVYCVRCGATLATLSYPEMLRDNSRQLLDQKLAAALRPRGRKWKRKTVKHVVLA